MLGSTMLESLQSNHTTLEGMRMLLVTWNVNAKLEEAKNLRKIFFDPEDSSLSGAPEIIVMGLQEMVELSTSNVIGGSMVGNAAERVEQWRAMLLQVLKERDLSYEMVTSKNMVGLWITVFSLRAFRQHISKVQVASIGRGVGGVLGNKGAVYARFNVKDTSICLVCAHFAAHREQLQRRNEDFYAILTHKAFPGLLDAPDVTSHPNLSQHAAQAMATEAGKVARMQERIDTMKRALQANRIPVSAPMSTKREQLSNYTGPLDHDIIIWIGDLNYRLLGGMENSRIYDLIDGKRSHVLLAMDQLNIERENGNVFQGFHEGLITFDPTYKYLPGNPIGYNRERCPAWCDRILWKLKHSYIQPGEYDDLGNSSGNGGGVGGGGGGSGGSGSTSSAQLSGGSEDPSATAVAPEVHATVSAVSVCGDGDDYAGAACDGDGVNASVAQIGMVAELAASASTDCYSAESSRKEALVEASVDTAASNAHDPRHGTGNAGTLQNTNAVGTDTSPIQTTEGAEQPASATNTLSDTVSSSLSPFSADAAPGATRRVLHSEPDAKVTEIVELMVYSRAENMISDHKPVRALMGIKYKKVDWIAHERHLLEQFGLRCQGRPYHSPTFQAACGMAPVTFEPRVLTLLSGIVPNTFQRVVVCNNSHTNTVRFSLYGNVLPEWVRVTTPWSGLIAPRGTTEIVCECVSEEADRCYMEIVAEESKHLEDQLRPVWRRHLRNPDDRGTPQLTIVLKVDLFTHPGRPTGTTGEGTTSSQKTEVSPIGAAQACSEAASDGGTEPPAAAGGSDGNGSSGTETTAGGDDGGDEAFADAATLQLEQECVFKMTSLLIPIICKVAST